MGPALRRVLIVDDDAVMRELLEVVLGLEGHTVHTADSGQAALSVLDLFHVDVVLMDMQMPGLAGGELARELRRRLEDSALLLAMSGNDLPSADRPLFDGFLRKPFGLEIVAAVLASAQRAREAVIAHDPSAASMGTEAAAREVAVALDEGVFSRFNATLPRPQLAELYRITLEDAGQRIERMQQAETVADLDSWRREAHALKGGCGMVGALELSRMAARAEGSATPGTPPLADFRAACVRLRRMLEGHLTET